MSVETSAYQISVIVTDNTSAQVLGDVEQNLNKLGGAGMRSGAQVERGMKAAGAGILSAREKTRLAAEEMGVHFPRAMITLIGHSKMAQAALNSVTTAMIGFATIQIGAMVFEAAIRGAEKLWHNVLNINQAVEDYQAQIAKTKKEDLGNTRAIETTTLRIDEATAALKAYQAQADELKKRAASQAVNPLGMMLGMNSLLFIHTSWWAHNAQSDAMEQQKLIDQLRKAQQEQQHEQRVETIELEHAYDWRLDKEKQITEERRKQHEIDAENAGYTAQQEGRSGNPVGTPRRGMGIFATSGEITPLFSEGAPQSSTQATKDALADAKADKGLAEERDKGHGKEKSNLSEENRLIHERVEAEREITRLRQQTQLQGMKPAARIQQEGENREANISTNDPIARTQQATEIRKQTAFAVSSEVQKEDEAAAAQRQRDEGEQARVDAEKARSDRELTNKKLRAIQETEQIEARAGAKFFSAEKQKTAAIQIELNERKTRYQEELDAEQISQDDHDRRVAAAEREANAERIQASTEARKKMAGEFTSFFKGMEHPGKYFQEMGDKAAGEAAASLVQRFQQRIDKHKGRTVAEPEQSGGFLGDLLGGFGLGAHGKKGKTPGLHGDSKAELGTVSGTAEKMFSITSAIIHVGSATIMGAGMGPGGSTAAGNAGISGPGSSTASGNAGISVPGSTSLLAPAGSSSASAPSGAAAASGISGLTNPGASLPGIAGHEGGHAGTVSNALGNVNQGIGLAKQLKSGFAGAGKGAGAGDSLETSSYQIPGKFDKSGNFIPGDSGNKFMNAVASPRVQGTVEGGLGVWSAHESGGGASGALQGGAAGAQAGIEFGGPIGAVIGGVAGAIVGAVGSSKKPKDYDYHTVRPRIANDLQAFHSGGMNYSDAYSDAQSLQQEAQKATKEMGHNGVKYYNNTILPEIKQFMGKLTSEQRAGRSMNSSSPASYATGTSYVPETGYNLNHAGERIFSSVDNSEITRAVTEGNGSRMPVQPASMGDVHLHVHAIDAHGVVQFFDKYKHDILSATNDARGENSGGGLN
jgi:hypothetical protein